MSMIESSSFSLPNDLLIEILLCLPVKTLLRFKSVCKSWFLLIKSSEFIHRHTAVTSSSSSKLGTFIFQSTQGTYIFEPDRRRHVKEDSWSIFSISGDGDGGDDHQEFEVVKDLDQLPPCYLSEKILMKGSCNGLICLYNYKLRDVFLWNPAIHNQFRLLPRSSFTIALIEEDRRGQDLVAFGFDVETKDYKVLLVIYQPIAHVQVYSLSTDSWRTLDVVLPTRPRDINNGGYLNGSYYCSGCRRIDKSTSGSYNHEMVLEVLSFDFTKEIFKTMPMPDEIISISNKGKIDIRHNGISFLGEKIAATFNYRPSDIYELWVLNEVGVKESWTKLYKLESHRNLRSLYRPIGSSINGDRPIVSSNNGEFIFVITSNGEKLWLLNPSTQVMKEIQWDCNQRAEDYSRSFNQIIKACVYRSSLVPVWSTRNDSKSSDNAVFDRST